MTGRYLRRAAAVVAVGAFVVSFASAGVASNATPARLTEAVGHDTSPVYSPDGSKIAFLSDRDGRYELYVMNADGTNETRLTYTVGAEVERLAPAWSPDGTKLAFTRADDTPGLCCGNEEVYVVNADGTGLTNLTNNAYTPFGGNASDLKPAWSPDGRKIAFMSIRGSNWGWDIYVMNADGTGVRQLTDTSDFGEFDPAFSPDGTKIAFGAGSDIRVMNADGTGVTDLVTDPATDTVPRWSPDGSKIAYIGWRGGYASLYVVNPDGSADTAVASDPDSDVLDHAWSADGRLAFTWRDNVARDVDIAVVDRDGSGLAKVAPRPGSDHAPTWSPAAATLVYASDRDESGNIDVYAVDPYAVVPPPAPAYAFEGFFAPVDNLPVVNALKAGAAVPVRFGLGGDQGIDIFDDGYPRSQSVPCDSSALTDGIEETVTANESGLVYDAATARYVYVWKTNAEWSGTCRQLVIKLDDGTYHRANFLFR